MHPVMRAGKRVAIAIAGGVVILVGLVLSIPFIPGPGLLIVVLGLAILALEFERPRAWMAALKARAVQMKHRLDDHPPGWLARLKARSLALKQRLRMRRSPRRDG
jgi:hypothetical protein